jgi:hypothetical protein
VQLACNSPENNLLSMSFAVPEKIIQLFLSVVDRSPETLQMKIITINFITCPVKICKTSPASFPLHFRDAELECLEIKYQPTFIRNVLPRIDWDGLHTTASEVLIS